MPNIHGTVRRIKQITESNGGGFGRGYYHSTTHLSMIELEGGQQIEYRAGEPAYINVGDVLNVSGTINHHGIFHAVAYYNETNQVKSDNAEHWQYMVAGAVAILVSPAILIQVLNSSTNWMVISLLGLITLLGITCFFSGLRKWKSSWKLRLE